MNYLYLLVGCSASGKSTFAGGCSDVVIVCPDTLRGILGSGEHDQSVNRKVFEVAQIMVDYLLKGNYQVMLDATNYSRKNRKDFIEIARKNNSKVVAYCFDVPLEVCKERNSKRDRKVPEDVIERQFNNLSFPDLTEVDERCKVDIDGFSIKFE